MNMVITEGRSKGTRNRVGYRGGAAIIIGALSLGVWWSADAPWNARCLLGQHDPASAPHGLHGDELIHYYSATLDSAADSTCRRCGAPVTDAKQLEKAPEPGPAVVDFTRQHERAR